MSALRIGGVTLKNNVILAPMAGVSDLPFRLLCHELGAGLVCMEMVSAKAIFYGNKNTERLLDIHPKERPVSLQLFGSDPVIVSEMAKKIEERPFSILDFNMGCPVPKVVNNGEGSALLKNPKLAAQILEGLVKAVQKPVTVKIRMGFDKEHIRYSLLLAEDGSASFSHEPEDWLELTSALEQRQERALSNFARALGDTASPVCQADNRELIRHCPPVELHTAQEAEDGRGAGHRGDDARTLIIDSLVVESAAAFSGDVPRGVSPSQVPWDGRKIIIDSLFVEAIMGICEGGRPSRIRQKAFAALRNGKRRFHGWLRRHSRLYELLISMGLKELYFKIKRRSKL